MRRPFRVTFAILAPPFLGCILGLSVLDGGRLLRLEKVWAFLGVAYAMAGIPAVVFAGLLELAFWKLFPPRSFWTLALALGLGALSGGAVAALMPTLELRVFFSLLGAATGGLVGLVILVAARLVERGRAGAAAPGAPPGSPA